MTSTNTATWPEGVIARYLTVGGAHIDITHDELYLNDTEPNLTHARCGGCPAYRNYEWAPRSGRLDNGRCGADADARDWAQTHAETCRAVPRPVSDD